MYTFPVGFVNFHKNNLFNFQFNRWYSSGFLSYELLAETAKRIECFEDWVREFKALAECKREEGDMAACATCLRAAEFLMLGLAEEDREVKQSVYEACMQAYEEAYRNEGVQYVRVPFENVYFPVLYKLQEGNAKGAIVLHGGYDSYIQEFVPYLNFFYEHGYNVYLFEGFGQGEVLNRCNRKMRPDWETCTSAVLDYFGLEDVTLIGVSLGGYLAARAAAFEPRIKRVVLYDIIYDFFGSFMAKSPALQRWLTGVLLNFENAGVWKRIQQKVTSTPFGKWLFLQGCSIWGVDTLPQYLNCMKLYNTRTISKLIRQDVLLLAGEDDVYTVYFEKQRKALTAAQSVEGRIFTREENASHHCQIGNLGLALSYIIGWIERKALLAL